VPETRNVSVLTIRKEMRYIEYVHRRKSSCRGRNGCCTKSGNKKSLSDKAPLAHLMVGIICSHGASRVAVRASALLKKPFFDNVSSRDDPRQSRKEFFARASERQKEGKKLGIRVRGMSADELLGLSPFPLPICEVRNGFCRRTSA